MIVLNNDTVLTLSKKQAVALANFTLYANQNRIRFKAALEREERLQELWKATSVRLEQEKERSELLNEALVLREEELKDIQKLHKKEKRKKFIQNTGVGIVIGVIGTLLLVN